MSKSKQKNKLVISKLLSTLVFVFYIYFIQNAAADPFGWPANRQVALSITYDDGNLDNQLNARPDLEFYGFRGSFYLTKSIVINSASPASELSKIYSRWRQAALKGHEIGNHSATHRCAGTDIPNVNRLKTQADVLSEITDTNAWIDLNINQDRGRTYAYPCGEAWVGANDAYGEAQYLDIVRQKHIAARWNSSYPNSPVTVKANPLKINAYAYPGYPASLESIRTYLNQSTSGLTWLVIVLHSVGNSNGTLNITRPDHQQILKEIYESGKYWVAPVKDVVNYIYRYYN
jgi:sialate O-acetylesterase